MKNSKYFNHKTKIDKKISLNTINNNEIRLSFKNLLEI